MPESIIHGYIADMRTNRAGDRSEQFELTVSYESSRILGSLTIDFPIEDARHFYLGQRLEIVVRSSEEPA